MPTIAECVQDLWDRFKASEPEVTPVLDPDGNLEILGATIGLSQTCYQETNFPAIVFDSTTADGTSEIMATLNFSLPSAQTVVPTGFIEFRETALTASVAPTAITVLQTSLTYDGEALPALGDFATGGTAHPALIDRFQKIDEKQVSINGEPRALAAGAHTLDIWLRMVTNRMDADSMLEGIEARLTICHPIMTLL